jgi:dTDP-4-amino-4,6-dideoxygalactose transaminase
MALIGTVPRRCVNLPPGALGALVRSALENKLQTGAALEQFREAFARWLGVSHMFGAASGRSAFQLGLESLGLESGAEIIFPVFTFPVIPLVAQKLGYRPVFCDVDPETYNAGVEHIEPKITDRTGAIVATHLYGEPCPIEDVVAMAQQRGLRVMEDCAHACGVRVNGRQVGTFGDMGVFSFAEGKNMPCFGGGAIATADDEIAKRAENILSTAPIPESGQIRNTAVTVWAKWLLTRPFLFGITAYPALRLKLLLGQPLMDYAVGDDLLAEFERSNPRISRMSNLQAIIGLIQLKHIDAFNEGARRNAKVLSEDLGEVSGITTPPAHDGNHIYVYYPLGVTPEKRDDLRHYLLRHGIDSKTTDMSNCTGLKAFGDAKSSDDQRGGPSEDSILEICVYPVIPEKQIRRIARVIKTWAGSQT